MNRRTSTAVLLSVAVFVLAPNSVRAEESTWIYPQSKLRTKAGSGEKSTAWPNESIDVRSTEDAIGKVVAYYVTQSGFEPPNRKILQRDFPYPNQLPVSFWMGPGKSAKSVVRVTLTHDLRPDVAQVTFLVVADSGEITSVSITRGKNEDQTWIQLHRHSLKAERAQGDE